MFFKHLSAGEWVCAHETPLASTVYSGKPTITLHLEQSDRQLSQRNRGWGFMPEMALRISTGLQSALESKIVATKLLAQFGSEDRHLSQLHSGSLGKEEMGKSHDGWQRI